MIFVNPVADCNLCENFMGFKKNRHGINSNGILDVRRFLFAVVDRTKR